MPSSPEAVNSDTEMFTTPPDPGQAGTLDELVEKLRLLKVWAGDPSYEPLPKLTILDSGFYNQTLGK